MDIQKILQDINAKDPTWEHAAHIVQKHLSLPSPVLRLVRGGWGGQFSHQEFLRLVGGARLNVGCLLEAAGFRGDGRKPDVTYILQSLTNLGIGYSTVVLAINLVCRRALKSKPPALWRGLYRDLISAVQVGATLGTKVPEIGEAGGALMGFSNFAGPVVLLMEDKKAVREWRLQTAKHGRLGEKVEIELFGCQPYQVGAITLQHLGFGTECAVGAAIGLGELRTVHLQLDRGILRWNAAQQWINALRLGRDVPRDLAIREFFPELKPPKKRSEQNLTLSVLYTEIAKVKSQGSDWLWHLPYPGYDLTAEKWELD